MFCREVHRMLSLYLDGLLSEAQARSLEEHAAGCVKCQVKLELMEQIPTALQSDKSLAPSPDFTRLVMQQVVMQKVVSRQDGNYHSYSRTQVSFISYAATQETSEDEVSDPEAATDEPAPDSKIISLNNRRQTSGQSQFAYLLRFTSLAAAFVLGFGFLAYAFQLNSTPGSTTDTTGQAVRSFATLLTDSFSNPWEVVLGAIVAAVIIVTLWVMLMRMRHKEN